MIRKSIVLLACLCFSCTAAAMGAGENKSLFSAAISFGGDDLGEDIRGGGDMSLSYGRLFPLDNNTHLQLGVGLKYDYTGASNGDIWFYRIPLELMLFKESGPFRAGGGLVYHFAPTYEAEVNGISSKIDFDDAVGIALQVDLFFKTNFSVGIRYEYISYTPEYFIYTPSQELLYSVDGSSLGIYGSLYFK